MAFISLMALGGISVRIQMVCFLIVTGTAIIWFNSSIADFTVNGRTFIVLFSGYSRIAGLSDRKVQRCLVLK
jgi:hypothetical protein